LKLRRDGDEDFTWRGKNVPRDGIPSFAVTTMQEKSPLALPKVSGKLYKKVEISQNKKRSVSIARS